MPVQHASFHYASSRLDAAARDELRAKAPRNFSQTCARLLEAVGACAMQALAELFQVGLSTVSDVKRREKIPVVWLYHLLLTRRVSPQWIVYGTGPRILELADVVDESASALLLREALA